MSEQEEQTDENAQEEEQADENAQDLACRRHHARINTGETS